MGNGEKAAGRTNSVASAVFSRSSGEVVPQTVSQKIACKKAKQIEVGSVDSPLEAVQTGQKEAPQGEGEQAEGGPQEDKDIPSAEGARQGLRVQKIPAARATRKMRAYSLSPCPVWRKSRHGSPVQTTVVTLAQKSVGFISQVWSVSATSEPARTGIERMRRSGRTRQR